MSTWIWILIGAAVFFFVLAPLVIIPAAIYLILLVRTRKSKWRRKCSLPRDEEIREMFDIGMDWAARYAEQKREVDVYSGKYHLFGEYFDFGFDKAAVIIAGRTESLLYSYYFAEPYRQAGYNVLVIDNRSHGKSDGRLNSLGYHEHRDILRWAQLLHDELGNRQVFFHGVCIGASNALFALTAADAPDYLQGMVSEGMFTTLRATTSSMTDRCFAYTSSKSRSSCSRASRTNIRCRNAPRCSMTSAVRRSGWFILRRVRIHT